MNTEKFEIGDKVRHKANIATTMVVIGFAKTTGSQYVDLVKCKYYDLRKQDFVIKDFQNFELEKVLI